MLLERSGRRAQRGGGNLLTGMSRKKYVISCHKVEWNFFWVGIFLRFFRINPDEGQSKYLKSK
jgi:hypothetical protein